MSTHYVSSNIGNNDNAGTSESAPLAGFRAALSDTAPRRTPWAVASRALGPGGLSFDRSRAQLRVPAVRPHTSKGLRLAFARTSFGGVTSGKIRLNVIMVAEASRNSARRIA